MAIDIRLRLYDFPSKAVSGLQSLICKDTDIDGDYLLKQVAKLSNVTSDRLILIFCGRTIKSNTRLKATAFKSGHLLQVLYKPIKEEVSVPDVDPKRLKMTMTGLHLILRGRRLEHKSLKKNVIKLLNDSKRIQKIIDGIPGFKNQPILADILRRPDIFSHVVEPTNMDHILEHSKPLGAAILMIWDNTPSLKSMRDILYAAATSRPVGNSSRDEFDEDDMDLQYNAPGTSQQNSRSANASRFITSNQLAQALSMANSPLSGQVFPSPGSSTSQTSIPTPPSTSSSSSSNPGGIIPADVFSMAMQQALRNASNQAPNHPRSTVQADNIPSISSEVMQRGLEQLRMMGLTNDRACKEALIAAEGNVETAVNILFSSEGQ